jgi:hypothetical protein
MKKQIITGIVVGTLVPTILVVLSTIFGWLPKTSDYRIPRGTIAAFALTEPPDGWEIYERAKGRFIIGAGSPGAAGFEQSGGIDPSRFLPSIFAFHTGSLSGGANNYLVTGESSPGDFRPPFISLLICRKK